MKQLLGYVLFLLLSARALGAQAQHPLAGTAWQATVRIPHPTAVVFQFQRDTVRMFDQASRAVLETMVYSTKAKQFTWRKVSGNSPCDTQTLGTYAYRINKDQLLLTVVSESCEGRIDAFTGEPLKKVVWPAPQ